MDVILIGAGGHARVLMDVFAARGDRVVGYVDPQPSSWLNSDRFATARDIPVRNARAVMGFAGVTPEHLRRRLAVLDDIVAQGFEAPAVQHPSAVVSPAARIEPGAMVLAGAIVQPAAVIGRGAIVNTGAIVEHDSVVEAGAHIAPGAIVLGGVRIGSCAMIGAGSVVVQGAEVAAGTLVKAQTRYPA